MKNLYRFFIAILIFSWNINLIAQDEPLDANTRANLILDIAKYIQYNDDFDKLDQFSITVMDYDDKFYWSLDRLASERQFVQGKPIRINLIPNPNYLKEPTQIVYLHSVNKYNIKEVMRILKEENTLVITEGYPFKESMINFLVVEGKPQFEANEELMNEHDIYVDALFLAHAIKTREDWEMLYEVTDVELQEEKEVTKQQKVLIAEQDSMIQAQIAKLKSLGDAIFDKEKELEEKIQLLLQKEEVIVLRNTEIAKKETQISTQQGKIAEQQEEVAIKEKVLQEKSVEIEKKAEEIVLKNSEIAANEEKIAFQLDALQKQKIVIWAAVVALILMLGLAYFIYVNYKNKKKANQLLEEKNRRIEEQKQLAEMQRDQIAYQKKHITDSINYAQKIQRAILPSVELFSDEIEHFVLYKPRDIVSGDYYWVDKVDGKQIIVTADCTGHGVPGAFMSMLGVSLLNEIILNRKIVAPHEVLNNLREMIIDSLNQRSETAEIKDGMDMTVTLIDFNENKLYYAGANNPLYLVRNGELEQFKASKMPVAIHEVMNDFDLVTIDLQKGDTFYTFSDGYVDQFGGPNQKKFLSKNFKLLLTEIQDLPMLEQGKKLDEVFEEYRSDVEQVDDVVVIGVRY